MKKFIQVISLFLFTLGQGYSQWEGANFPDSVKVNTLAISGSNIFAGTDGNGIFVSTDNSESWVSINEGLQSKIIHTIFINGTTIFAGTETGASVSTNNGLSWDTINSGLSGSGVWSFAVSEAFTEIQLSLQGSGVGFIASTDNGRNWEATGLTNTLMPIHSIVIHKDNIYAATFDDGVFLSQDNGLTWKNISVCDAIPPDNTIVPVCSLSQMGNYVIAGLWNNNLYSLGWWVLHF